MRTPYTPPHLDEHGSVIDRTADLGQSSDQDFIFNNTAETQFGIPPGQTVPGDDGSVDIIIRPA